MNGESQKEKALACLRKAMGRADANFRPGQWESIEGVLQNRRQLVVQKTGWGKSMVYFVATRLLRDKNKGVTLLISPLLSLMRNQIDAAARIGVRAVSINSSNTSDWASLEEQLLGNQIDLLLISPERLANEDFQDRILQRVANHVGLFVVDEAHCISDWGHDFRPDYRRIVRVLNALPSNIPVLATTATANDRVVRDVSAQLGNVQVIRGPLLRESLALQNIWFSSPPARLAWLAEHLKDLPGSGIIYTLTIRDAERVTEWLKQNGYNVEAYHSQLDSDVAESGKNYREEIERRLLNNEVKALVATVALGMGFDKPDLRFVIHYQRPGSVVHYYQQVGRAGRAVDHAYGILLGGAEDSDITNYFIRTAFPPQTHVEAILQALNASTDGLSVPMLQERLNLTWGDIDKTLKMLSVESPSPVAKLETRWYATPVVYKSDQEKIDRLCALRQSEQQKMMDYMRTGECLMQFLQKALDDPASRKCGKCSNCLERELIPSTVDPDLAKKAAMFLKRSYQPIEARKRWPADGIFEQYTFQGTKIDSALRAEEGRALCLWGDAGWGESVRNGKYRDGRFAEELVEGCAQMFSTWNPRIKPRWVTCIPSLTHPELVPEFAARLAAKLGLPFAPALRKIKQNAQQKTMRNSHQQVKNLDGVFQVERDFLRGGPVLLVDDMVDSRWTFTVAGALLRQAGCPAVLPLALALNSTRSD